MVHEVSRKTVKNGLFIKKAKKTKMRNVKLQHKWGHNKERGCVNFLVTKVASTKVPSLSNEVT
jgi:hypothetical protein